jgi:hypothetical protein
LSEELQKVAKETKDTASAESDAVKKEATAKTKAAQSSNVQPSKEPPESKKGQAGNSPPGKIS